MAMSGSGFAAYSGQAPAARSRASAKSTNVKYDMVHMLQPRGNSVDFSFAAELVTIEAGVIKSPEQSASVFNTYLNWVFGHELPLGLNAGETWAEHAPHIPLVEAYALGNAIMDGDFRDAITDAFMVTCATEFEGPTRLPDRATRQLFYSKTPDGSQLRKLLVHQMTAPGHATHLEASDDNQFLVDLARNYDERDAESVKVAVAKCRYHEHAACQENCYRKKYGTARMTFAGPPVETTQ
ncbi:hypothetical protein Slin15195_G082010 [Septoria linicola]|uniref:Uncharacterized protein n=1 Tax=Septoria linicola TaxID=215465 RepID=A0A9Q9AZT2_9PEZI|nr:hypothetical protein Slin15195_G082010 [Septoria linicola]